MSTRDNAEGVNKNSDAVIKDLTEQLEAAQQQRRDDYERFGRAVRELDWLRRDLRLPVSGSGRGDHEVIDRPEDDICQVKIWELKAPAERAEIRKETRFAQSFFARIWAALLLHQARKAAKSLDYARAEIFYQAVLAFRPRGFLWRQVGNMMAGQGLYRSALQCFDCAIACDNGDAEAWFVKGVALLRLNEVDNARSAFATAISLNPGFTDRSRI